jgi:hypothetical protein
VDPKGRLLRSLLLTFQPHYEFLLFLKLRKVIGEMLGKRLAALFSTRYLTLNENNIVVHKYHILKTLAYQQVKSLTQ